MCYTPIPSLKQIFAQRLTVCAIWYSYKSNLVQVCMQLTYAIHIELSAHNVNIGKKGCRTVVTIVVFPLSVSVFVDNGHVKPKRKRKGSKQATAPEADDNLCLLRATNGKKKISTVVSTTELLGVKLSTSRDGPVKSI